ncbi:MAG: flippase-like domain-containing protein [Azoarcus sp.]|jgi:uncharacterized protein (TIRG00374 family)|nr:flippase-like domain-containing protein [Azoarcus sp.]
MRAPSFNPAADAAHDLPDRRLHALVWPVLLAMAGYLGFALWSGWDDVIGAVRKIGYAGVGIALGLSLVNYALRFARWQTYLAAMGHAVPWRPSLGIYLAGFALTATPGKAGEALRGLLLKRWKVPLPDSFAAFLSERLSDLLAVMLLALGGLALYPSARWPVAIGAAGILSVFAVLLNRRFLEKAGQRVRGEGRWPRLLRHVLQTLLRTRHCHAPRLFAAATVLSLIAWFAEAFAFHLALHWMGQTVPLFQAVFIYAAAMLAGALSFLPGGLGGAEAVMAGLLILSGMPGAEAAATTIVIRAVTLWFAVAIGGAALFGGTGAVSPGSGHPSPRGQET